ncbi:MAG: helix-turn-helix transcriptional regulator [Pseudomonadota bacterium]
MSMNDTFAHNLRVLCDAEPSVSAVCRGMGVNRQQFSRYLAGTSLPNRKNLDRICEYFGVSAASLFRSDGGSDVTSRATVVHRDFDALVSRERPANLAPGLYFVDFTGPDAPGTIVRSVTIISHEGPMTTFRRLTNFGESRNSWWGRLRGDHHGVVIERRSWFYFVALDSAGSRTPSMLVLKWAVGEEPMLVGHSALMASAGPMVIPTVMSPCPRKYSLRGALRQSRAYPSDDIAIDMAIQDALEMQSQELVAMTRKLDIGVRGVVPEQTQPSSRY